MFQSIKRILFILFFLFSVLLFSQNKTQLEKEKQELESKINETSNLLNKEKKKKNSALEQLELSNIKIKQHTQLFKKSDSLIGIQNSTIKAQDSIIEIKNDSINNIENNIKKLEASILKRENDLIFTQKTLSKIIYQTYVWKHTYNERFFLISSGDLNQLYKRNQYLNQLAEQTKKQTNKIKKDKKLLAKEKEELETDKVRLQIGKEKLEVSKDTLESYKDILEINQEELNLLEEIFQMEKNNKQDILSEIEKNEQIYTNKLNQQEKESKAIEEKIKKIIEEEIIKSREELGKKNSESPLTPEALELLSSNFTANKGNLPWPLEKGIIVSSFGIKKISGIETKNNGIDFNTDEHQNCRVVFDGTVSRIFEISGGFGVLVNHGSYFTIYSVLKDVIVKSGDKVIAKQKIGTIITSETTKETQLHFEIWKGKEPQNPVKWLYKAN